MNVKNIDLAMTDGDGYVLWVMDDWKRVSVAGSGSTGDGWTNYPDGKFQCEVDGVLGSIAEGDVEYVGEASSVEQVVIRVYSDYVDEDDNTLVYVWVFALATLPKWRWLGNPIVDKRFFGKPGQRVRFFPYWKKLDYLGNTISDVALVDGGMDAYADADGVVTLEYSRLLLDTLKRNPNFFFPDFSEAFDYLKDEGAALVWYLNYGRLNDDGTYESGLAGLGNLKGIRGAVGDEVDWLVSSPYSDQPMVMSRLPATLLKVRADRALLVSVFFPKYVADLVLTAKLYSPSGSLLFTKTYLDEESLGFGSSTEGGYWTFWFSMPAFFLEAAATPERGQTLVFAWAYTLDGDPFSETKTWAVDVQYYRNETQLVWRNALYGWETMLFVGEWEEEKTIEKNLQSRIGFPFSGLNKHQVEKQMLTERVERVNVVRTKQLACQWLTPAERNALTDSLLSSKEVYLLEDEAGNKRMVPVRILNKKEKTDRSEPGKSALILEIQYINESTFLK